MHKVKKQNAYIYIYILVVALISFTLISSLVLSSHSASANSTGASVVVPAGYCNVTTGSNDVEHTATINNGIYQENIGTTTFKVVCGDNGGYSIYAIGYSNNEYGNTKLLATVQGALNPSFDILTSTSTSGDNSAWSMKLTPVSGTFAPTIESDTSGSFSNYHTIPTTYTKVATFPSVTDAYQGSSFQSTYATYISSTQPAGTYVGRVKYTMVHPEGAVPNQPVATPANKIGYVPNANGLVVDTMADQEYTGYTSTINGLTTPLTPGGEATLWASNFKRPGYGFAGWNTAYDYSGATYGPNETITVPTNLDQEGLTLYAVWIKSQGKLQDWNGCSAMTVGQVTALTDTRDNNTYAIAKLADGKCWMIENLRLGGANQMTLTPADTDIATNFTLNNTTANWCTDTSAACVNQSFMEARNTIDSVSNMTTPKDANIYSYGNYYNWYSATAGTGTYSIASGNATGSICPRSWRLPSGNINGDFYNLDIALGGNGSHQIAFEASERWRAYPNNTTLSFVGGMSANNWSSTAYKAGESYHFGMAVDQINPIRTTTKPNGLFVRCLAR